VIIKYLIQQHIQHFILDYKQINYNKVINNLTIILLFMMLYLIHLGLI